MHLPELLADTNTWAPYGVALIAAGGVLIGGLMTAGSTLPAAAFTSTRATSASTSCGPRARSLGAHQLES